MLSVLSLCSELLVSCFFRIILVIAKSRLLVPKEDTNFVRLYIILWSFKKVESAKLSSHVYPLLQCAPLCSNFAISPIFANLSLIKLGKSANLTKNVTQFMVFLSKRDSICLYNWRQAFVFIPWMKIPLKCVKKICHVNYNIREIFGEHHEGIV